MCYDFEHKNKRSRYYLHQLSVTLLGGASDLIYATETLAVGATPTSELLVLVLFV